MSRQNTPTIEKIKESTDDLAHETLDLKGSVRATSVQADNDNSVPNSNSSSLTNSPSPTLGRPVLFTSTKAADISFNDANQSRVDHSVVTTPSHLVSTGENTRRSPGRPKRKRTFELETPHLSSATKISGDRSAKLPKTEESIYRITGATKNVLPSSRQQPKRGSRNIPSPSPPPYTAPVHSGRRKTHSRSHSSSQKNQEYQTPSQVLSPSPLTAPSVMNERAISNSISYDERQKTLQKEAVVALKRMEIDYAKLKTQIYQEKHAELTRDVEAIQNGTSTILHERCQDAKDWFCKRIDVARKLKQYSLWEAKQKLAAEQCSIDMQFLNDSAALKEQIRDRLLKERWALQEAKAVSDSYLNFIPKSTGKKSLFVKSLDEEEAASDLFKIRGIKERVSVPSSPTETSPVLQPEQAVEELIPRNAQLYLPHNQAHAAHNSALSSNQSIPWAVPGARSNHVQNLIEVQAINAETLMLARTVFKVGDHVLLSDISQASSFSGVLVGVGSDEIMIQRSDGSRTRVNLSSISQGRYKLQQSSNFSPPFHQGVL